MNNQTLLQQLKDVHLPPVPDFWPISNIGFIILGCVVFFIIVMSRWIRKIWVRNFPKRIALKELSTIKNNFSGDTKSIIKVSILLRRVALAYYPRSEVAGLVGNNWLQFLDRTGDTHEFSAGAGTLLVSAPYQLPKSRDIEVLLNIVEKWIKQRGKNV